MDRFDKYFVPGLPYLDRVVIRVIKDPVTQMVAFKAGQIDSIADYSADHVDTLRAQNPRAQVMTGKETTPMVAMMKVTVPADGKPMSKERRMPSSTTSGSARPSAATASTGRRSSRS